MLTAIVPTSVHGHPAEPVACVAARLVNGFLQSPNVLTLTDTFIHRRGSAPEPPGSSPRPEQEGACASYWLREINNCLQRGRAQTLDLCRVVSTARAALKHGQWSQLWKRQRAPFSKSKADKLARIGTWLKTLNAHTCEHLPAGWRILRVLSRLDAGATAALVASGDIHVDLTFRQAEQLVARILALRPPKEPSSTTIAWVIRFCRRLRTKAPELDTEELYQISDQLDQLLTEIRTVRDEEDTSPPALSPERRGRSAVSQTLSPPDSRRLVSIRGSTAQKNL